MDIEGLYHGLYPHLRLRELVSELPSKAGRYRIFTVIPRIFFVRGGLSDSFKNSFSQF
jgi:hypothetical protein